MNARARARTYSNVRSAGLVAALLLVACAARGGSGRPPARSVALAPGRTRIVFGPGPNGPYRLERLAVVLDGALIYLNAEPAEQPPPRLLADMANLPAGEHTVTTQVRVSRPCTPLGVEREVVEVRASDTFALDGRGAAVELRLVGADPSALEEQALRISFWHHGAAVVHDIASPTLGVDDFACAPLAEPERARCRVDVRIVEARRARDVVWLACLEEKRQAIDAAHAALSRLGDAGAPEARAAALEQAVRAAREADACLGLDMAFVGAPSEARVVRACEGDDPFLVEEPAGRLVLRTAPR